MTPDDDSLEDVRSRLRVLEKENELLADRAEEIALLGLVAENTGAEGDPFDLLASVLEQVCILKAIPYGVCLEPIGSVLIAAAACHLRRGDGAEEDQFRLNDGAEWPPKLSVALDFRTCERMFDRWAIAGPPFTPSAVALVPLRCSSNPGGCLLFADDRRTPEELSSILPLLNRVADLTQVRLDNLALVAKLKRLNLNLDLEVTERTEALRRSEERYRTLFDHVPDAVLLVNAEGEGGFGRIEDANEAAAAMHGYSLAELKALDIEALNAPVPGHRLESFEARACRLKPGETVREELTHLKQDGTAFPVEAIGTLVRIHGRQYVLGFLRDITERKRSEQALLRTQRTESVGVLAGGIAHDFNNLLTAIMGQTGLALDLMDPQAAGRENLGRALDAAGKAATLTQQMLAYSGRGKFTIQPVSINGAIQDNLRFLEAAIPKQVRFELELDPGSPIVIGDPSQVQQVIMNLVINGAEAIGDKPGCISIRTRAVHLDSVDASRWPLSGNRLEAGDFVWIEVEDTGCGMSREVLSRVFDPFFSTKAKGHGLGLSAVQGIIRAHRGGLGVDSETDRGTTFRILLPAGSPDPCVPEPPATGALECEARVVLVIDDEDYMLEVVRDVLESHGHSAFLAQSGEEGIELLRRHGNRVDVVLLDLSMPGLGGAETLRRLREVEPRIPVVLSSGFAEEEVMVQIKGMDFVGFLQKPYLAKDLMRVVESAGIHKGPS
ncbi:MAG: response regulator [Geothrix sp.]|nr:response regulator [Geothrix sp.]